MMKILHVRASAGLYGAEYMLLSLAEEQNRQGLSPIILSIGNKNSGTKDIEIEAEKRGIKVSQLKITHGPNLFGSFAILKMAKELDIDIIHSHGYKPNILLGLTPRFLRSCKLLTTLHGWTSTRRLSKLSLYKWADQKLIPRFDGIVVVNKQMLEHRFFSTINKDKLHVVNNGISIKQDTIGNSQAAAGLAPNALTKRINDFKQDGNFVIGGIGRLSEEKAFMVLLEAFAEVTKLCGNVRLVIIGDGLQRPLIEAFVESKSLSEKVLLAGFADNAKQYLPLFDLLVIPSLTEGLPLVLLEAMLCKTPIIATAVGGIPDVLQGSEFGETIPAGDTRILANSISRAIRHVPELLDKAERAQQHLYQNYSAKKMCDDYSALYSSICN